MNLKNLSKIIEPEPKYRADQIKRGLFIDLSEDWDVLTGLPKTLREKLKKECPLDIDAEIFSDTDGGAIKALIRLADGKKIETVLMSHIDGRNTVCVS